MPTRNSHIRFILFVKHLKKITKLNNYNLLHHNFLMGSLSDSGQNQNSLRNFETRNFISDLWERSALFIYNYYEETNCVYRLVKLMIMLLNLLLCSLRD